MPTSTTDRWTTSSTWPKATWMAWRWALLVILLRHPVASLATSLTLSVASTIEQGSRTSSSHGRRGFADQRMRHKAAGEGELHASSRAAVATLQPCVECRRARHAQVAVRKHRPTVLDFMQPLVDQTVPGTVEEEYMVRPVVICLTGSADPSITPLHVVACLHPQHW